MTRAILGYVIVALSASLLLDASVCAQPYPSKPIRLVIPYPPGSTADMTGRLFANKMSETLGQPIVTDNRVGAGGVIGASMVAKASADGYTLLYTTPSTHVMAIFLSREPLPYDPLKDFTPIGTAITSYQSLAVSMPGPVSSIQELVQYAKRNPGKLTYGSAGIGTVFHLAGEAFASAAGVELTHVPYKSAVQNLPDVATGLLSMTFSTVQSQLPFYRAGKVRIIGVLNPGRYSGLPEVPAVAEIIPAFERPIDYLGFMGPAGLPRPIVQRWSAEVKAALGAADIMRALDEAGQTPMFTTSEEFLALIKSGQASTEKMVKAAGIKPQ